MGYWELRSGWYPLPGQVHFVTAVTFERHALFSDFANARAAIIEMRRLHDSGMVRSLAWVLMPDHLHWLLALGTTHSLSVAIKSLKGRTARVLNERARCTGPVWQRAFFDRALRREEDVRAVARYIVLNPVRRGLVRRVGDYPHWDAAWL